MSKWMTGLLATTILSVASAHAQTSTTTQSLRDAALEDARAAVAALEQGSFQDAASQLQTAAKTANQLHLRAVSNKLAVAAPSFDVADTRFALAQSARVTLEDFIKAQNVLETTATAADGSTITVRVIGDEDAMKAFVKTAENEKMAQEADLELAQMLGEPALKRKGADGSLTVATMSEADHALIEIEGDSEDAVMSFINEIESAAKN